MNRLFQEHLNPKANSLVVKFIEGDITLYGKKVIRNYMDWFDKVEWGEKVRVKRKNPFVFFIAGQRILKVNVENTSIKPLGEK